MPISDLDIVCAFDSDSADGVKTFAGFLDKLIPAIQKHQPEWNLKRKEVALGVETCVNTQSDRGEFQLPMKLYADIVFKSSGDKEAIIIVKRRSKILNGVPSNESKKCLQFSRSIIYR